MAASIAHEIRNPLAGISGTMQILAASLPDEDERRLVIAKVQQQIARMNTLASDLFAFARPVEPRLRDTELDALLGDVVSQIQEAGFGTSEVQGKGCASADADLLSRALYRLVQNAWQAGASRVVLQVEDGCVRVLDDGPGLPRKHAVRVFDPFFTTKSRGSGLGLALVKKILEEMQGSVATCPSLLGGAGFCVTLPRSVPNA